MISISTFSRLLSEEAQRLGWLVFTDEALVSPQFRGRSGRVDAVLPEGAVGLKLGRYPVLVCSIDLRSDSGMDNGLREAHNQAMIARSYLRQEETIDAHIMFLGVAPREQLQRKKIERKVSQFNHFVDRIERDESVCRKFVWLVTEEEDPKPSFQHFVERTFLSRPWKEVKSLDSAPLDRNERLVEMVLKSKGLTERAALEWVRVASEGSQDPRFVVDRLVDAMEIDHEL